MSRLSSLSQENTETSSSTVRHFYSTSSLNPTGKPRLPPGTYCRSFFCLWNHDVGVSLCRRSLLSTFRLGRGQLGDYCDVGTDCIPNIRPFWDSIPYFDSTQVRTLGVFRTLLFTYNKIRWFKHCWTIRRIFWYLYGNTSSDSLKSLVVCDLRVDSFKLRTEVSNGLHTYTRLITMWNTKFLEWTVHVHYYYGRK